MPTEQNAHSYRTLKREFRHIPPLVLQTKSSKLTSGDKIVLSIIIHHCQYFDGRCELSNATLAYLASRKDSEYIRIRLARLERLGYIIRHNSKSTKRYITLTQKTEQLLVDSTLKGLNIEFKPPHWGHTKLIIRQHFKAFPDCHIRQRARFLGISESTLRLHVSEMIGLPVTLLPRDYVAPRPPRNLHTYNRGVIPMKHLSIHSRVISNDITPSFHREMSNRRRAIILPSSETKTSEKVRRLKERISTERPFSTDLEPKKQLKPVEEIEQIWNALPNVRAHKNLDTKVYKRARQMIYALARGQLLRHVSRKELTAKLVGYGLKPSQIVPLLTKKFSKPERIATYERLNRWLSNDAYPEYRKYMPRDLPSLIYSNRNKMSWFLFAYLVEPNTLEEFSDPMEQRCAETIDNFLMGRANKLRLRDIVKDIHSYWDEVIGETLSWTGITEIRFPDVLLSKYCQFLELHYDDVLIDVNLGWFSPESIPFRKFLVQIYSFYGNRVGEYEKSFYRRMFRV